jgi:hypothetical protein
VKYREKERKRETELERERESKREKEREREEEEEDVRLSEILKKQNPSLCFPFIRFGDKTNKSEKGSSLTLGNLLQLRSNTCYDIAVHMYIHSAPHVSNNIILRLLAFY